MEEHNLTKKLPMHAIFNLLMTNAYVAHDTNSYSNSNRLIAIAHYKFIQ